MEEATTYMFITFTVVSAIWIIFTIASVLMANSILHMYQREDITDDKDDFLYHRKRWSKHLFTSPIMDVSVGDINQMVIACFKEFKRPTSVLPSRHRYALGLSEPWKKTPMTTHMFVRAAWKSRGLTKYAIFLAQEYINSRI